MNITKEQEDNYQPITQEEILTNHDIWWNSLSNEDKEKLFEDTIEAEKHFNNLEDIEGPNSSYGV
jgi:hypothetical protein|tara:strand:+ start:946 stop:1140 length:195 start_codon:yes stop_codon:yes gene_type:complete